MKRSIEQIVGKRGAGVIVKESGRGPKAQSYGPKSQVFLIFDDDTSYELYADALIFAAGARFGGVAKVRRPQKGVRIVRDKCETR